jgi:hypothetical protein
MVLPSFMTLLARLASRVDVPDGHAVSELDLLRASRGGSELDHDSDAFVA